MKQEVWNLRHQPMHKVLLFWAVGHLGAPEVISCRRSVCSLQYARMALGAASAHSSNTFICPDTQFGRQRNLGRGHETRGFVSHSIWSHFSFLLPLLSCFFLAVLSVSPPVPKLSQCLSSSLPLPSSSLTFFCSWFNGIAFSGVFYKMPWGGSRNTFPNSLFWLLGAGIHSWPLFCSSKTTIHSANHCFSFCWLEGERIR